MEPAPRVIPPPVMASVSDSGPSIASLTRGGKEDKDDKEQSHLHDLIAHYISTHYPAALPAFLSASGAEDPAGRPPPNPDLRTVVSDAASAVRAAELASMLQAASLEDKVSLEKLLALPLPDDDILREVKRTIQIAATNLLAVTVADVPFRRFDTSTAEYVAGRTRSAIVSAADRQVRIVDYESGEITALLEHKAPVLAIATHPTQPRYLLTGSMDGSTSLIDLITSEVVQRFSSCKFVVRVAFSSDGRWMAAASYDHTVTVYEAEAVDGADAQPTEEEEDVIDPNDDPALAAPPTLRYTLRHTVKMEHNPEAILFHPSGEWLMYTMRSSHELHYLRLPGTAPASTAPATSLNGTASGDRTADEPWSTRTKSFNPHPLDSHVSFAVLDLALHPSGRMIACITGDHAGTAGERVLIYGVDPDETNRLACLWTGAESDAFVLPRVAWLPCGRGLITSSATGGITLMSTNGDMRSRLQVHQAQGPGTSDVVRDMAVVPTTEGDDGEGWEVVSVGYDRCLRFTRGKP